MREFETLSLSQLDLIIGGAENPAVEIKGTAEADLTKMNKDNLDFVDKQIGRGSRVLACAAGAWGEGGGGLREFGNCLLTGHLGGVPKTPQSPAGQ